VQEQTMPTIELTKDNFGEVVNGDSTVIIDFWASWCGPCKRFAPIFEEASADHDSVVFAKVNTEEQQELAGYFGIRSIPTVMVFRERVGVFQQAGLLPRAAIDDILGQVAKLDMDQVRAEVEAQQQAGTEPS
jgi:thioredoxin 1